MDEVKPSKFNGTRSCALFWCQFVAIAEHSCWMRLEKSTYLIIALQCHASDMVHGVLKGATYEEGLQALEDCFRDQPLAAAYFSQLNTRT
jgi:hypothetical protein